ncbi:Myb-like protein [Actinidia chinensis var. chinensis]|uniref:Myb-like protein n=1 Tax=Actinidia chinensis var. chinensis TaxID=1590841 RepID=A0A2R6PYL8_ACTCC|nr:Myb-like protein [Actinidia chinensis var. chinensis]
MEMKDPSEDWRIQEYSESEGSDNVVSWILEKGLNLGKKIVITGVVISSAPLILPPLVVISALGFAVSVPFGLFFASYACTEKLMSKLLPGPKSPLLLGNGPLSKEEMEEVDFEGDIMEEEGKYQIEDVSRWDEMGTKKNIEYWHEGDMNDDQEPVEEVDQNVKEEGYEEDVGEYMNATKDYRGNKVTKEDEEEQRFNIADEEVKEEGYEEDVGEYSERADEGKSEGVDVENEGMGEKKEEESMEERSEGEHPLDEVRQVVVTVERGERNGNNVSVAEELDLPKREVVERGSDKKVNPSNEKKDLGSETTGLVEKLRDEGAGVNSVEKEMCRIPKESNEKNFNNAEAMEKSIEVKSVISEKLNGETKQIEGERRNEGAKQNEEIQEQTTEDNVMELVVEIGGTNRDEENLDNIVVVEKPSGDLNGSINGSKLGKIAEIVVEQRPLAHKRAEDQIASDMHEALELEREKKRKIDSNADAREIADESGFDLFDDRNGASDKYSYDENPKECETASDHTPEGDAGLLELHVRVEVPKVKDAGVGSDIDTLTPASKVALNEEKIREQINALRTIVGYKIAPHEILVEELKALYIFTGVEPPASFKSPSDLVDVNDKLQFLMSIVGVK